MNDFTIGLLIMKILIDKSAYCWRG